MNRVYKVIYNRARNLYQVVSEITHSRGKARTVTARQRHERLTTSILIALLAMGTSLPVGWAADPAVSTAVTKDDANAVSGGAVYMEVRPTWGIVQRVPTLTVLLSAMLLVHQLAILLSVLVQLQRVLLQELANGRIQ